MAKFNFDDFTANLPDAFAKNKDSNNYKLLQIEKHIYDKINGMLQSVFNILDIDNATGAVLDAYGERLNVKRTTDNDKLYLIWLKTRIAQNLSDGSRNSVASALAYVLSTTSDRIRLEVDEETRSVKIVDIPLDVLDEAGCTPEQIKQVVESMLSTGVYVQSAEFTGTFEFGEGENEYDAAKGFADDNGTIGGYFGLLSF